MRRQLVVCGTKGTVELRPFEWLVGEKPGVIQPLTTGVRKAFDKNRNAKAATSVEKIEEKRKPEDFFGPRKGHAVITRRS